MTRGEFLKLVLSAADLVSSAACSCLLSFTQSELWGMAIVSPGTLKDIINREDIGEGVEGQGHSVVRGLRCCSMYMMCAVRGV